MYTQYAAQVNNLFFGRVSSCVISPVSGKMPTAIFMVREKG